MRSATEFESSPAIYPHGHPACHWQSPVYPPAAGSEYAAEYVEYLIGQLLNVTVTKEESFVHGQGKRRSEVQRLYEKMQKICENLRRYRP